MQGHGEADKNYKPSQFSFVRGISIEPAIHCPAIYADRLAGQDNPAISLLCGPLVKLHGTPRIGRTNFVWDDAG
jgi:hypothetical protein